MPHEFDPLIEAWSEYFAHLDWKQLIQGATPRPSGCGDIYEFANPIDRPGESIAIADMRSLDVAEPHFHINGEVEIYLILQGSGIVVVGDDQRFVGPGDVIVIPPGYAHYTIPQDGLVLGLVNNPPFNPANYVLVGDAATDVHFDPARFATLASRAKETSIAGLLETLTNKLDAWAAIVLSPSQSGKLLACRARYNLPADWAVNGNRLDSESHNATAYNSQTENVDNKVIADLPPSGATTRHRMTATAAVLIPGDATLEVLADTDGYEFDEEKLAIMREVAAEIDSILLR